MLSCLSASERKLFEGLLDKLAEHVPQWSALDEL